MNKRDRITVKTETGYLLHVELPDGTDTLVVSGNDGITEAILLGLGRNSARAFANAIIQKLDQ